MEEMSFSGVSDEKEREGGEVAVGEDRRMVGRERLGGRRWRRRESASAAVEVERWLLLVVVVDGVGGGAEVEPPP